MLRNLNCIQDYGVLQPGLSENCQSFSCPQFQTVPQLGFNLPFTFVG
jgi:hypothetical protein